MNQGDYAYQGEAFITTKYFASSLLRPKSVARDDLDDVPVAVYQGIYHIAKLRWQVKEAGDSDVLCNLVVRWEC